MSDIDVLLLGSGGREHALAWKLAASPLIGKLYAAPGNPGIAAHAECVEFGLADHDALIAFCRRAGIGLVVVGPEAPLVAGIVDDLAEAGIRAFGPTPARRAARGIRRASRKISAPATASRRPPIAASPPGRSALDYLGSVGAPVVVKADGLAAGKGVTVARTLAEAEQAVDHLFAGRTWCRRGRGGHRRMPGGRGGELLRHHRRQPRRWSWRRRRITSGRTTATPVPNTGGMGAYSPAPVMTEALREETMARIVEPTIRAMAEMGAPYRGVLYAGLMLTSAGPKLIEYNVRFGDPECQVLMPRLKDDLLTLLLAATDGTLDKVSVRWRSECALTVVMAARGYPGDFERGTVIRGLDRASAVEGVEIFHAGTVLRDGQAHRQRRPRVSA